MPVRRLRPTGDAKSRMTPTRTFTGAFCAAATRLAWCTTSAAKRRCKQTTTGE
jgi:hypothetical protein